MQLAERLAEDQQPQGGLNQAGEQLGPVVAELLEFDQCERAHPQRQAADAADPARREDQCGCGGVS
ncbi:hypothetical protein [Mycolicibacterium sp. XJ870]